MLVRLFAVAILLAAPVAFAAAPPGPTSLPESAERFVIGELALAQPTLTTVVLTGDLYLYRYDINDKIYDADEMGDAYHGINKYQGEASGKEFVEEMETAAENSLRSILASSFLGANISAVKAEVDESSLVTAAGNPFEPPVALKVSANIARPRDVLGMAKYTDAQVGAVFASGATLESELKLTALSGYALTYAIGAPATPPLVFTDAEGGTVSANGQTVTVRIPNGATSVPATLTLRGKGVPTFTAEDASIAVLVDIADVEASTGKALSGDMGTLLVDITVSGELKVVKVPEEVAASLPKSLHLEFLPSDAIRLLRQHGLLTEENMTKLESELANKVNDKLGRALGGNINAKSGFDSASLEASHISTPASKDKPIVFKSSASVRKPLAGGGIESQAAIALYTQDLPLKLPTIEGADTLYTVIAPPGLAFTSVTGSGADITKGTSADGRDQFTVRPTSENAQVLASVAVTPAFVVLKFFPLLLLAVLLLILIVGTPVAIVVMKRRKGKSKAEAPKK